MSAALNAMGKNVLQNVADAGKSPLTAKLMKNIRT